MELTGLQGPKKVRGGAGDGAEVSNPSAWKNGCMVTEIQKKQVSREGGNGWGDNELSLAYLESEGLGS